MWEATIMAMSLGSSGRGVSAEMNVTPLIDVLLVLIIIFMIIRPLSKTAGLDAEIPQPPTDSKQPLTPERTVVIEVAKTPAGEESITINREPVAPADLESRIRDIYKVRAERVLFIKGTEDLDFENVSDVIDAAHGAFPDIQVGLITEKIESGD
jgi:biopolymer transport protein TolR